MFSIVQDIAHIGQQGDCGLYFGPNSPQSPGDIVSFDFFSMANSFSWQYRKIVNRTKEHSKKHSARQAQSGFKAHRTTRTSRRGTAPTADGRHFHRSSALAMLRPEMHCIAACCQLARDGRTMDAKLMRWQQIIMTFGARVQIMSTSGSACEMDQESRKYRGACPRRCPPRHATHIVSHARFRRTQFEKSSR